MPNVVVYVPTKAWKILEERGLDPAKVVREFAKKGYDVTGLGEQGPEPSARVVAEVAEIRGDALGGDGHSTPPRASVEAGLQKETTHEAESPVSPSTRKRMHPCKHHLPPSKHCPYGCDG